MQLGKKYKGLDGSVTVFDNRVEISDKKLTSLINDYGTKIIFLSQMTAIQFAEAKMLSNGCIQFVYPGSMEKSHAGVLSRSTDENTIVFSKNQQADFEEIRDYLIKKL
jgi:hypothetical protein